MENLNKENFWNALHEKCPDAMEHFMKWIDDYKKEIGWDGLFASGWANPLNYHIKFHDIPFEMQNGIIARYELEVYNNKDGLGKERYENTAGQYRQQVRELFIDLQKSIIRRKQKMN